MEYSEIGLWSEAKLDIVAKYAKAYSTILSKQEIFIHVYIDGFAGPGLHRAKLSGRLLTGSPLNALEVRPPFAEYHFIDLDKRECERWRRLLQTTPTSRSITATLTKSSSRDGQALGGRRAAASGP